MPRAKKKPEKIWPFSLFFKRAFFWFLCSSSNGKIGKSCLLRVLSTEEDDGRKSEMFCGHSYSCLQEF